MKIGNVTLNTQLVLAPMAGVTDLAFRTRLPGAVRLLHGHGDGQRQGPVLRR